MRNRAFLSAGLVVLFGGVSSAVAEEGGRVEPFFGSFATEVPIAVPLYHELQPEIKLVYSSAMPNGFAGLGWGVTGTSAIVRSGPRKGAPRYDASDVFVFDGEELMPAVAGTPCAALGGTHCTSKQSYNRIARNEAEGPPDSWSVYFKNGTKATFTAVFSVKKGQTTYTFRYGLTQVRDTIGNVVTYGYSCDLDGTTCLESYLETISYNGNQVRFYRESRPDTITYATGAGIAKTQYRLKSIAVRVSGQLARAYQLTYLPGGSATTQRSLLGSVQQFGRSASVDGMGNVTGAALPAMTLAWGTESDMKFADAQSLVDWCQGAEQYVVPGDFNGDGRTDLLCHARGSGDLWIALAAGGSFAAPFLAGQYGAKNGVAVADFNGDGRDDLWRKRDSRDERDAIHFADDTGGFASLAFFVHNPVEGFDRALNGFGDFNGDGKSDFVYRFAGVTGMFLNLSNGDGTFRVYWLQSITPTSLGDIDGDGKTDIGAVENKWLSNGNGTFRRVSGGLSGILIDVNGDGRADNVTRSDSNGLSVRLSHGDGTFGKVIPSGGQCAGGSRQWWGGDFNGDGVSEIFCHGTGSDGNNWVVFLDGGAFRTVIVDSANPADAACANRSVFGGDFDGDGKTDFGCQYRAGTGTTWIRRSVVPSTEHPGLLVTEVRNGAGGRTTVAYKSSTDPITGVNEVPNPGLPFVVQAASTVTTDDGRGNSNTLTYTFEGGKWSWSERRFLGFRKVKSVIDAQANFSETFYHQHVGCTSKPEATYVRDAHENIFSFTKYDYDDLVDASGVYTSRLIRRWDYECNLGTTCRAKKTELDYDDYANVTQTREWGGGTYTYDPVTDTGTYADVPGDERTVARGYFPNTPAYIVALPGFEDTYPGIGTGTTTPLRQERYIYDGNTAYNVPPVKGLLTHKLLRHAEANTWVTVKTFGHDAFGNVIREDGPKTGAPDPDETTMEYALTYGGVYLTKALNGSDHSMLRTWDAAIGQVLTETDANGGQVTYEHDAFGRVTKKTLPDGGFLKTDYLDWGSPAFQRVKETTYGGRCAPEDGWIGQCGQEGVWKATYHDGLGRVYKEVRNGGPQGFVKETEYDSTSRRVKRESDWYDPGAGETARFREYLYDGAGRLTRVTNPRPDATYAETSYWVSGALGVEIYTDERGQAVKGVAKDAHDRTLVVWEPVDGRWPATSYEYDALGRLRKVTDAAQKVTSADWDSLGRKIKSCNPDAGCWRYTYTVAGELETQTDAEGRQLKFGYDGLGRVTGKFYLDAAAGNFETTPRVKWTYDEAGRGKSVGKLTTLTDPWGSTRLSYDFAGRVTETTKCIDGSCRKMTFIYDGFGRLFFTAYPAGDWVRTTYDASGREESVFSFELNRSIVSGLRYNARDQVLEATYGSNTKATFTYNDDRRWMTGATVTGPGAQPLYQASYGYDDATRLTSMASTTNASFTYGYDNLGRVKSVTSPGRPDLSQTFTYDDTGNITSNSSLGGTYTYGDPLHAHAVTAVGTSTYRYDANGNMTSRNAQTLLWGDDHLPVTITEGASTTSFGYDGEGQRVKKVAPDGKATYYFGPHLEESSGTVSQFYYAGPVLVARSDRIGATTSAFWLHQDHLGSVKVVTDGAAAVVSRYDYAAFGTRFATQAAAPSARGFGGHQTDPETGLVYMNARYYDAALGRFISPDTIVPERFKPQGLNRYAFAYNNPVSNVDPTGHAPVAAIALAVSAWSGYMAGTVALSTAIMTTVGAVGAVTSMAGMFLHNELLSTIGAVMSGVSAGYAGYGFMPGGVAGAAIGGAVAGATSPLSPLDPGVKMAVGWAYTAQGMIGNSYRQDQLRQREMAAGREAPAGGGGIADAEKSFKEVQSKLAGIDKDIFPNGSPLSSSSEHSEFGWRLFEGDWQPLEKTMPQNPFDGVRLPFMDRRVGLNPFHRGQVGVRFLIDGVFFHASRGPDGSVDIHRDLFDWRDPRHVKDMWFGGRPPWQ